MKNINTSKIIAVVTVAFAAVTAVLTPVTSYASIACSEILEKRLCMDGAPRTVEFAPGLLQSIPAPIIDGYGSACWDWSRKFQCVETAPIYKCDSGTSFNAVKADCSLVASNISSTAVVNGITYITAADYAYRCAWGSWSEAPPLPPNKECVMLDKTTIPSNIVPAAPVGVTPPADLTDTLALTETRNEKYVCYSPPVTSCANTCSAEVKNPNTGLMEKQEVACTAALTDCKTASNQCTGTAKQKPDGSYEADPARGPDGRCISSVENQICQAGDIPKCLTGKDNCTFVDAESSGIQDNGTAMTQTQNYVCTDQKTSCTELANVSNCVHAGAWGWDQLAIKSQVGQGLAEYNQAISKLEGVEKGMKTDDPYIFSGQDLRCHYAVGNFLNTFITIAVLAGTFVATGGASVGLLSTALQSAGMAASTAVTVAASVQIGASAIMDAPNSQAFGSNCCKDYVFAGSDAWYKIGTCTADEIKLSVAKRKGLSHYLGEYCSKKSGFPIRQCVQKSRSYCVFDDMLALTVNEQGRTQLDALAAADPVNTRTTSEKRFALFGNSVGAAPKYTGYLNTGRWTQQANENGSQIWTWQYPAYCSSTAAQTAAHDIWLAEVSAVTDTKGIQPDKMTKDQALKLIMASVSVAPFQECPATLGTMSFLTCSKNDDSCDTSRLPEGPTGVETDLTGIVTQADVNWRVQQSASFYKPGDYGVTTVMPSDSSYAAVSDSINEFVTAVGSCHRSDGQCVYYFAITDKVSTKGLGAKKRSTEYAQFPLYSSQPTTNQPAVNYVSQDGVLDTTAYNADPNRGLADPLYLSNQRFIFHPNYITKPVKGNIHSAVLVEYATAKGSASHPENDYEPLVVPTSLPPGTPGWYPHGNAGVHGKYFYLSGGCNPNSRWCNYEIMVDLDIPRHPWGTAQEPRCWGFSLEQMAALDFDKMDLSRWINSLDLDSASAGLSADAASAMSKQVTDSAQAFYSNVSNSQPTNKPGAGTMALVTNTDILPMLSNGNFRAYVLEVAVPTNWPNYFPDGVNNNPVSYVHIDWGDGSPQGTMQKDPGGKAFVAEHDYGDLKTAGRYKISVTLDTKSNGPQALTTFVTVTPDGGGMPAKTGLEFNNPGTNGKVQAQYNPADTLNGMNQSPTSLKSIAPGMADEFDRQGTTVTPPGKKN